VVLLQYPREGLWSIGLVATERANNLNLVPGNRVLSVFVPTTPNPTSGYLVIVSPDDVTTWISQSRTLSSSLFAAVSSERI
jgi:uncharacterized membrane protein